MSRLLILEANEICPDLLERFGAQGLLPNFGRLAERSACLTTLARDECLNPWTQWVTFHLGVPQSDHGIERLNRGSSIDRPFIWDRLGDRGEDVLAFGPMNAGTPKSDRVELLPDPWTKDVAPTNRAYDQFFRFVSANVQKHAHPGAKLPVQDAVVVGRFLMGRGLRPETATKIVAQLMKERPSPFRRWERALLLDQIYSDVFFAEFNRRSFTAGLLFLDGLAHLQHRYWRHAFPEEFTRGATPEESARYGTAIERAYVAYDRIIGRCLALRDTEIVLVGALSQKANLRHEEIGGKFVYAPTSFADILDWAGVPAGFDVQPVMSHHAWVRYADEAAADRCAEALRKVVKLPTGQPLFNVKTEGAAVFFYVDGAARVPDDLSLSAGDGSTAAFHDRFHSLGEVESGGHDPHGAFWVPKDWHRAGGEDPVPLEAAASIILKNAGATAAVH